MQCSRARLSIGLAFAFVVFLVMMPMGAVAEEHVAFGLNRQANSQPLAFTNDAPSNETETEVAGMDGVIAIWLMGESGSGSFDGGEGDCGGALSDGTPGAAQTFKLVWGSNRLFAPPDQLDAAQDEGVVHPLEDMNVTIGIESTDEFQGPIAFGDVKFTLEVGWIRPPRDSLHGPHGAWTGSTTVSPTPAEGLEDLDLPGTPGQLPSQVDIPVPFTEDQEAHFEANSILVYFLTVECNADAFFTLSFGDIGDLQWTWGDPAEDDTDADGLPDSLDTHPDGTQWSREEQIYYGTNALDPNDVPSNPSEDCADFTIQEAKDTNENYQRGNPDTCPDVGGFPFLLLFLALLLVVALAGGAFGAVTTVNKKVRMSVSHDGFQDIKKGESARYELTLTAKGKEDEQVPVELSLKGVPEDWSASVEPAQTTLVAGEEPEPVTAVLTVTPPPEEEYEAEAVVTVTATPTDEDGKTSPVKPGTSVKTKTIVNIDMEPPEGEKRRKGFTPPGERLRSMIPMKGKQEDEPEEGDEEDVPPEAAQAGEPEPESEPDEGGKKKKGLGFLKRRTKTEESGEADASGEPGEAAADPASQEAAASGKPDLAVGKLAHDPEDFSAGDEVTTTVPVKNKGDEPVQGLLLRLYVNDDRVAEQELDLEAGEASEVTFTWTAQPDENRVRVRGGLKEA